MAFRMFIASVYTFQTRAQLCYNYIAIEKLAFSSITLDEDNLRTNYTYIYTKNQTSTQSV